MGKRRIKPQLQKPKPHLSPFLLLLLLLPITILLIHLSSAGFRRANSLGRRCSPYATQYSVDDSATKPLLKIAMVSFSDEDDDETAPRQRSFKGVMELVGANKRSYAEKMGYNFIDAGGLVDHSRPPSWSKILAVRFYLRAYDWVFWNDADFDIRIEVLVRIRHKRSLKKLHARHMSPYMVVRSIGSNTYDLDIPKDVFNVEDLIPYYIPEEFPAIIPELSPSSLAYDSSPNIQTFPVTPFRRQSEQIQEFD